MVANRGEGEQGPGDTVQELPKSRAGAGEEEMQITGAEEDVKADIFYFLLTNYGALARLARS